MNLKLLESKSQNIKARNMQQVKNILKKKNATDKSQYRE